MGISVRDMAAGDVAFGMRLKDQAGWNQVEADWKRLLALQPDGCFVAELDGAPAGTVTTCRFGDVAWVAMTLVDAACRGRGVGRALMVRALDWLAYQRVRSVRLDATALGHPLYESLGFRPESTFVRYQGVLPPAAERPAAAPGAVPGADVFEEVVALDRAVTGADRGRLLRSLAHEYPESFHVARERGRVVGFVLARPGAHARQIGPCTGDDAAGPRLLEAAGRQYAGEPVILDVPGTHAKAAERLASWGLSPARELLRMGFGPRIEEDLDRLWVSAGAEKG